MSTLDEQWLQDVAESLKIQALNPTLCKMLLPVIEIQVKKITQQAHKFQRRSKSNSVTVDDVNSALAMNKIEPVYGLSRTEPSIALEAASVTSASAMTKAGISSKQPTSGKFLNLVEYGKASSISLAVPCPLLPEVSLHWLAVHGSQPLTADNPSTATTVGTMNADDQPLTLPKELQHLYARITGIILSAGGPAGMYSSSSSTPAPTGTGKLTAMGGAKSSAQFGSLGSMVGSSSSSGGGSASGLDAVLSVLQTDASIQLLTPYLSRFFYRHIKASTKRVGLLRTMITCIRSLLENPLVNLEFHLQQLLPAIFTCNVAAKLSGSPHEDHWSLRRLAADVIAKINHKFGDQFPELQARICKTFLYALDSDKSLPTVYGGLVGLAALGPEVVRSLLLSRSSYSSSSSSSSSGGGGGGSKVTCLLQQLEMRLEHITQQQQAKLYHNRRGGREEEEKSGGGRGDQEQIDTRNQQSAHLSKKRKTTSSRSVREEEEEEEVEAEEGEVEDKTGETRKSATGNTREMNQNMLRSRVRHQLVCVNMCREVLIQALGKCVANRVRLLPQGVERRGGSSSSSAGLSWGQTRQKTDTATRSSATTATIGGGGAGPAAISSYASSSSSFSSIATIATGYLPLCGLEENLVPYYATASKQDYYCRLMI